MDEIEALIAQIRLNGRQVWMAGSQSEASVAELEQAMGIAMPPSYRAFLLKFGGFSVGNSFISGIVDGESLGKGTGWLFGDTQKFREDYQLPSYLLVVEANEDAPYCLDSRSPDTSGEFPLVCYELHSRHVGRMANSFGEWFMEWLRLSAEED